jgi:hypothetical protein
VIWQWFKISLVAICALVALASGLLHWRSHRISSVGHRYGERSWAGIYCAKGKIVVGLGREAVDAAIKYDFYERPVKPGGNEIDFNESFRGGQRLGFGYFQSYSPRVHYFLAPLWIFWTVASIPTVPVLYKSMKQKWRRRSNLCVNCGYDVRGNVKNCPECGRELQTTKVSLLYHI